HWWLWPNLYLSLVLGSVAGIGMGLVISSAAWNADRAASLVPVVVIAQIIFSGVIVDLSNNGLARFVSNLMVTTWTLRALGTTTNLDAIAMHLGSSTLPKVPREFTEDMWFYLQHLSYFIFLSL